MHLAGASMSYGHISSLYSPPLWQEGSMDLLLTVCLFCCLFSCPSIHILLSISQSISNTTKVRMDVPDLTDCETFISSSFIKIYEHFTMFSLRVKQNTVLVTFNTFIRSKLNVLYCIKVVKYIKMPKACPKKSICHFQKLKMILKNNRKTVRLPQMYQFLLLKHKSIC